MLVSTGLKFYIHICIESPSAIFTFFTFFFCPFPLICDLSLAWPIFYSIAVFVLGLHSTYERKPVAFGLLNLNWCSQFHGMSTKVSSGIKCKYSSSKTKLKINEPKCIRHINKWETQLFLTLFIYIKKIQLFIQETQKVIRRRLKMRALWRCIREIWTIELLDLH
jgi:hypothetical protein